MTTVKYVRQDGEWRAVRERTSMEGKPITYDKLEIYPEYCGLTLDELKMMSSKTSRFILASTSDGEYNTSFILRFGKVVYARSKYRLHPSENISRGQRPPCTIILNGWSMLLLICYEILFPKDYVLQEKPPNLVVHLVGQPMFSEEQREGWVAMQEALATIYNCPVICCCGGPISRMNITGVTKPGGVI